MIYASKLGFALEVDQLREAMAEIDDEAVQTIETNCLTRKLSGDFESCINILCTVRHNKKSSKSPYRKPRTYQIAERGA